MSQASDIAKISQAWLDWNTDKRNLRFGQYVMNTYYPNVSCPSIFYEQNDNVAYQSLFEHLVLRTKVSDWKD